MQFKNRKQGGWIPATLATAMLLVCGCVSADPSRSRTVMRLAVTTSTHDSGLLEILVPIFEERANARVDVIAAGTGKSLLLGERGEVDAILCHSRDAEEKFIKSGHGIRREDVMFNTFEILGPPDDPAKIKGLQPHQAFARLSTQQATFVSRGDESGTHIREKEIWGLLDSKTKTDHILKTGQGMGPTLTITDQKQAYTICDRATFLYMQDHITLIPLVPQALILKNSYGVIVVNPNKNNLVNSDIANQWVDFLISSEIQQKIQEYQINGESLFFPLHDASGSSYSVQ
ncbi:substrate-binding domain-containing protein [Mariniblastus sp.]|nr:substrate-binding domain-containing protein [Mariniblastus sp.]MDB4756541.1 substrate-binding domain-containing protein [Mariniblastus sp.]